MNNIKYGIKTLTESTVRKRIPLDGTWLCKIDPDTIGTIEKWYENNLIDAFDIAIPSCIQSSEALKNLYPSDQFNNSYIGSFWLQKNFHIKKSPDRRYEIIIGGVVPYAHVWINGIYVSAVEHGLVSASIDITDHLNDTHNTLTVLIEEKNLGLLGGMRFSGLWSGLYRSVYIEEKHDTNIIDINIETKNRISIKGNVNNVGNYTVCVAIDDGIRKVIETETAINDSDNFNITLPMNDIVCWSIESPKLYKLKIDLYSDGTLIDNTENRVGFRKLKVEGNQFMLNDKPLYISGTGAEYCSPIISPLIDLDIIRSRWQAMKDDGFNFFRFHTSVPTEEELYIADELGMFISSEVSVISNFSKTTPFEEGLVLLKEHIIQTRLYPSMGVYCLGNEGTQIMAGDDRIVERNRAKVGYHTIKENSTEQLAIISFGMQGEIPELDNDFETPHLWGSNFAAAYDSLTKIPWDQIEFLQGKPCVIHEFGKFGVWPDPDEEKLFPAGGYRKNFATQGRETLERLGLLQYESALIKNTRLLTGNCWRNIMEGARRNPNNRGFCTWIYFRGMNHNSGFTDDFGIKHDISSDIYRNGVNAPVAVLTDRNFNGRDLQFGSIIYINTYISNFSGYDITDSVIRWKLSDSDNVYASGEAPCVYIKNGENVNVGKLKLQLTNHETAVKANLRIELHREDNIIAANNWNYWLYPNINDNHDYDIALNFSNKEYENRFKRYYAKSYTIDELDSIIRGCHCWRKKDYAYTVNKWRPSLLISDKYDDTVKLFLDEKIPVLLYDTGMFDEDWYSKLLLDNTQIMYDPSCSYSTFRSGWDQGNLGTIVNESKLIDSFPNDGFCDLQFYSMLQGTRTLSRDAITKTFDYQNETTIIRGLTKLRIKHQPNAIVQDPNAIKETVVLNKRIFDAREQIYLQELDINGGRLILCAMKLFESVSGKYLLDTIIKNLIM